MRVFFPEIAEETIGGRRAGYWVAESALAISRSPALAGVGFSTADA
jgi:hypothetical protein